MHTKALPMPHWSCKNGHLVSVQTGSMASGRAALGTAGARTPNTATEPATTIAAAMLIANGTRFM
jgi:hypothetical protein